VFLHPRLHELVTQTIVMWNMRINQNNQVGNSQDHGYLGNGKARKNLLLIKEILHANDIS